MPATLELTHTCTHTKTYIHRERHFNCLNTLAEAQFTLTKLHFGLVSVTGMVRTQVQHRQTGWAVKPQNRAGENQEGIGKTRGRRQKAEVISRAETRQAGRGQTRSATGDQSGGKRWKVRHSTRQSGTDAETGAGLNAARLSQVWRLGLMRRRG